MKRLLFCLLAACLLAGCGRGQGERPMPQDAGATAVECYRYLQKGDAAGFVQNMALTGNDTATTRRRLEALMREYISGVNKNLQGIDSVGLSRENLKADGRAAEVFLILKFGNGESEEVNLTMLYDKGRWWVR